MQASELGQVITGVLFDRIALKRTTSGSSWICLFVPEPKNLEEIPRLFT
jgi:hypothetical protein